MAAESTVGLIDEAAAHLLGGCIVESKTTGHDGIGVDTALFTIYAAIAQNNAVSKLSQERT